MSPTKRKPRPRGRGLTLLLLTPIALILLCVVRSLIYIYAPNPAHPAVGLVLWGSYACFALAVIALLIRLLGRRGSRRRIIALALTLTLAADFAVLYLPYSAAYTEHSFRRYRADRAEAVAQILAGERPRARIGEQTYTVNSITVSADRRIYLDPDEIIALFTLHHGLLESRYLVYAPGKAINEKLPLPGGVTPDTVTELTPGWGVVTLRAGS